MNYMTDDRVRGQVFALVIKLDEANRKTAVKALNVVSTALKQILHMDTIEFVQH